VLPRSSSGQRGAGPYVRVGSDWKAQLLPPGAVLDQRAAPTGCEAWRAKRPGGDARLGPHDTASAPQPGGGRYHPNGAASRTGLGRRAVRGRTHRADVQKHASLCVPYIQDDRAYALTSTRPGSLG
jgi:hypothetical protein